MDLYVYETEFGHIADFRSYLDGSDHSFDDHRALRPEDPRWEKINSLRDPDREIPLESLRFVGRATTKWSELMIFPIRWTGDFEPEEWQTAGEPAA